MPCRVEVADRPAVFDAGLLEAEDVADEVAPPLLRPTISEMRITFRSPPLSRASCTTSVMAEPMYWRMTGTGISKPAIMHHHLQARQGVARVVGVDRRQAALVAGVHRLQHVQRLGAAAPRR